MKSKYSMFLVLFFVCNSSYGGFWEKVGIGKSGQCKKAKKRADKAQEKYTGASTSLYTKTEEVKKLTAQLNQAKENLTEAEAYMKARFRENANAHENLRNCERRVRGEIVAPLPRPVGGHATTVPAR